MVAAFVSRALTKFGQAVHDCLFGLWSSRLAVTVPHIGAVSNSTQLHHLKCNVRERTTSQTWKGQALKAGFANDLRLHLACAMASGTVACLATQPVDCVKTRIINMQSTCVLVAGWCENLKGEGLHVQLLKVETILLGAKDSVCIYLLNICWFEVIKIESWAILHVKLTMQCFVMFWQSHKSLARR